MKINKIIYSNSYLLSILRNQHFIQHQKYVHIFIQNVLFLGNYQLKNLMQNF